MKLGIGTILLCWDNITWDKKLNTYKKEELKRELIMALDRIEVETDESTVQTILKIYATKE